jgi:predicted RNase H-like nuclease
MSPYGQRAVYEGNPELSFYQLNKDNPIVLSKRKESGRDERREVLIERIPGIDKVIDVDLQFVRPKHLNDAAALMWTARRVFGRAARRLPKEAEWDSEGLRMEIVI